jgi:toxin YoeB
VKITFTPHGWADYCSWADDRKMLQRINRLIDEAARDPAVGAGKPEPLAANLRGFWSRRITQEHRLVYQVQDDHLVIVQVRRHY